MSKLINVTRLGYFWTKAKSYIDTALAGKVDAVDGKGLSTNDLTAALKANYDAAYTHSNNGDVHVTAAQKAAWDAKADADHAHSEYAAASHSHAYADLTGKPTIPTTVAQLTDASNYALKSDIASTFTYKGSKATAAELPTSGNAVGDVWNVEETDMNYAWTGSEWDALGSTVTIEIATEAEIDALFA